MLENKGIVSKSLITLFGPIKYNRTQLAPSDKNSLDRLITITGKKSVYPLDEFLGIDNLPFKITVKMMTAITKEAVRAASYERAAESVCQHYGVSIGDDTVRKVTDFVGNTVFIDDTTRADKAISNLNNKIDSRKIHKRKTDVLYIEMDGAMVNTRLKQNGTSWTECKIAISFLSEDMKEWTTRSGDLRRRIENKRLIGYIGNYQIFKKYVLAMAERYDYKYRNQIVVISDGADWIHKLVKEIFPSATHILDLSHVKEHVGDFGKYIINDSSKSKKWIERIISLIEDGKVSDVLKELAPYKETKCPPNVLNLYTYIENHKNCMDYKLYRERGYFVGSGASESANKYTMQDRMKLQGMRWDKKNAQTMLALKCRLESNCWNEVENLVRSRCNENGILQG